VGFLSLSYVIFWSGRLLVKKFIDGLLFGSGFAMAFSIIWYVSGYIIYPTLIASHFKQTQDERFPSEKLPSTSSFSESKHVSKPFHDLTLDQQIQSASVIAVAKFELSDDGKMKAVLKEFLKKDPDTTFYYNIGDEHADSSYHPKDDVSHGDGVIIFFTGSPATMRMSISYAGDGIGGLGDIPLKLFGEKCKAMN
jgi:hypothetical protein